MARRYSSEYKAFQPYVVEDIRKVVTAAGTVGGGGTPGVTDHGALTGLSDDDHPQYLTPVRGDARYIPSTRTLTAGAGLTGGGDLSADRTFTVGAGLGITVNADDVALTTPGTLTVSSTNSSTGNHTHAITTSSDVSAGTSAILASNAGALTVASLYATTRLSSSLIDTTISNIKIAPALDLILDPVGNDVLPETNYDINLGALSKKYLTLHAAELWVETLVAQNTIATIGGRILVGPTTTLTRDLAAAATTIYVKHNEMASGDRTYMEANGKVEFFAITSSATNTGSDYSYTVTRNLDGTGANDWYAGDAMFNTGTTGEGFIDLYSLHGVKAGTEYGPTIVGNIRLSSTYNDWEERWAVGNLNGLYDYGTTVYGFAAGDPDGANVTADATNGVRMRQGTTNTIVLAPNGASYFAGVMTIDTNGEIRQGTGTLGSNYTGLRIWRDSGIGRIGGYNSNSLQWYANTDGKLYAGGGNVMLDATGLTLDIGDYQADKLFPYVDIAWKAGSAESGRIGSGELNNVDVYGMRFWAGGAGLTQSGNGKFEFISRNGSGTTTGTATITDGGFAGEGQVSGASLYTAGDLTVGGETNLRQHTTTEQWSVDIANGTSLTMANAAVFQFSDAAVFSGLIIVTNTTNGGVGLFTAGGAVVTKVADGSNTYATAKDTASKTNVYYDAGSSEYRMQNNTGGSRTYNIFSIRLRASS